MGWQRLRFFPLGQGRMTRYGRDLIMRFCRWERLLSNRTREWAKVNMTRGGAAFSEVEHTGARRGMDTLSSAAESTRFLAPARQALRHVHATACGPLLRGSFVIAEAD